MKTLEFISKIPTSQNELCEFHLKFVNVAVVTPPIIKVRFSLVPDRMVEGSRMTIEIRQFGRWIPWDVTVEKLEPNSLMIDVQSGRGPFKFWRHEHHFIEKDHAVFLMDRLYYQLPFGLLGTIIDLIIFRWIQKALFSYRHKKTREYFSNT